MARVLRVLRRVLESSKAIASAALAVLLDATGDGMAAATADIEAASMQVVVCWGAWCDYSVSLLGSYSLWLVSGSPFRTKGMGAVGAFIMHSMRALVTASA